MHLERMKKITSHMVRWEGEAVRRWRVGQARRVTENKPGREQPPIHAQNKTAHLIPGANWGAPRVESNPGKTECAWHNCEKLGRETGRGWDRRVTQSLKEGPPETF